MGTAFFWRGFQGGILSFFRRLALAGNYFPPPPGHFVRPAGGICDTIRRMELNQPERRAKELLQGKFPQAVFYGPPGTGKTRAALRVAADLLGKTEPQALRGDPRFALVQFHPACNYEDFVRGVQVKTENGQVVYETVDRVFVKMARRAAAGRPEPYVLVIDEINRANVSAVLGELIYALEYRETEVQTPYAIDDKTGLVIPQNLLVVGTMNTADRTIGQIDYAVRRRFAFVHCPPDRAVVQNLGVVRATEFFDMVDGVFAHLSPDHDAEDVRIGHSYFLAESGPELARKVIFQVVPILREYLKDGVLLKEAEAEISEIEEVARNSGKSDGADEGARSDGLRGWYWVHESGDGAPPASLRQMALSLVRDYARRFNCHNLEELRRAFPDNCAVCHAIALDSDDKRARVVKGKKSKYFVREDQRIVFPDGKAAVVCGEWGRTGVAEEYLVRFATKAKERGYQIYNNSRLDYHHFNVGDHADAGRRHWRDCVKYRFMSAGQDRRAVRAVRKLRRGTPIFAYRNGVGYVGFGVVTEAAQPVGKFQVDGKPLLECELGEGSVLFVNAKDESICEWVARIDWRKALSDEDAVSARPRPIPGHAVCRIKDEAMIEGLEEGFGFFAAGDASDASDD